MTVPRGIANRHGAGVVLGTRDLWQPPDVDAAVDLASVFSTFEEPWSPRTVAVLNNYDVRVVKTAGEFTRHSHPDTDEFFLVLRGTLTIKMDAGDVELGPGQLYVVPAACRINLCRARVPKSC